MTLKVEKPFDINQVILEKNMRLKTPMASTMSSYCSYTRVIETNTHKLKQKYPNKQQFQLKNLLLQVDNDIQTAVVIIQQQICQQKSHKIEPSFQKNEQIFLNQIQEKRAENSFLKRVIYKTYQKIQINKLKVDTNNEIIKKLLIDIQRQIVQYQMFQSLPSLQQIKKQQQQQNQQSN